MSRHLSILCVCSGNICRSPLAAALLREELQRGGVEAKVTSAGSRAGFGDEVTPQILELSEVLHVETSRHRSHPLTEQDIEGVDLVLGMARVHRRAVVELVPRYASRAFTLREFASLCAVLPPEEVHELAMSTLSPQERFSALIDSARMRRGQGAVVRTEDDDDVIDPIGRSDRTYQRSADQIVPAVHQIVHVVTGALKQESP